MEDKGKKKYRLPRALIVLRGLVLREGKVLLVRRSPTDVWRPGKWEFPGGKLDRGERLVLSLKREIHEEAGITVKVIEPLYFGDEYPRGPKGIQLINLILTCRYAGGDVKLSYEHDGFVWATPVDIRKYPLTEITEEALRRFERRAGTRHA
jgi:8-oxo-dGTP diphosphatase